VGSGRISGREYIPTTRVVARGAKAAAEPAMAATITDLYMVGGENSCGPVGLEGNTFRKRCHILSRK
jgi:hypothetical protein